MPSVSTELELENLLAEPSGADRAALAAMRGDLLILGAGGKMGPSLARRARRAAGPKTRIIAAARFTNRALPRELNEEGIETIAADLLDRKQVDALPDTENVIFMAGRKFGSTENQPLTWAVNTWTAGLVAERFAKSRIVAFSTGNVYPFETVDSGGATEATPAAPVGEYAQSALARERVFQYFSGVHGTPLVLLRLNYAIDLRYGVLLDIGQKVFAKQLVDVTPGYVNVIWQGDANSICLRSFALCEPGGRILNLTGPETLPVRRIASEFGRLFGIEPVFAGREASTALLSNASRCHQLLGAPTVSPQEMIEMVAHWIRADGPTLGKPTHFETRDGAF